VALQSTARCQAFRLQLSKDFGIQLFWLQRPTWNPLGFGGIIIDPYLAECHYLHK
jgi:hypothetical protein